MRTSPPALDTDTRLSTLRLLPHLSGLSDQDLRAAYRSRAIAEMIAALVWFVLFSAVIAVLDLADEGANSAAIASLFCLVGSFGYFLAHLTSSFHIAHASLGVRYDWASALQLAHKSATHSDIPPTPLPKSR